MNSRERVIKTLNFEPVDRLARDLGGVTGTGLHASTLHKLRRKLGLKEEIVIMYEPVMQLGKVTEDVIEAMGTDVIGIDSCTTLLGYQNKDFKLWRLPDGTPVKVGSGFEYEVRENGRTYLFPQGDRNAEASAHMPKDGYFFDPIIRQSELIEEKLNAKTDYATMYSVFSDEECELLQKQTDYLFRNTELAIFGNFWGASFGDFIHIPGSWLKETPGVRDWEEWLLSHLIRPAYIREYMDMYLEIALENLKLYKEAVGDKIVAIAISGTDFGTQKAMLISPEIYREMYKPYHKIVVDWVKKNTNWKVFFHSCGAISDIIDDFIEIGVDCLNPVQFTARGMDLESLTDKYAGEIVFWGGGIDTQKTLPFGSIDEIIAEAKHNKSLLNKKGGYIGAAIHNIQFGTEPEKIIAFFEAIK